MNFQFLKGRVVEFELDSSNPTNPVCGKVEEVYLDEVVIIPQRYVAAEVYDPEKGTTTLNPYLSIDTNDKVHVDRERIVIWRNARVPSDGQRYFDVVQPYEVKIFPCQNINRYSGF